MISFHLFDDVWYLSIDRWPLAGFSQHQDLMMFQRPSSQAAKFMIHQALAQMVKPQLRKCSWWGQGEWLGIWHDPSKGSAMVRLGAEFGPKHNIVQRLCKRLQKALNEYLHMTNMFEFCLWSSPCQMVYYSASLQGWWPQVQGLDINGVTRTPQFFSWFDSGHLCIP